MKYLIWSDFDPNNSFEIEAENKDEVAFLALSELGYCISSEPYEPDAEEEEDD